MILLSVGVSILFCIFVEVLIVIGSINLNFNLLTSLLFVSQNLLSIIWFLLLQMKVPLLCNNDRKFIDSLLCWCSSQLLLELVGNWAMFE